jgi:hypothetical protein
MEQKTGVSTVSTTIELIAEAMKLAEKFRDPEFT